MEQMRAGLGVELYRPGDPVEAGCARQRSRPLREASYAEVVEGVEGDAPVRGQLAAGDADHPARAGREDRLPLRARRGAVAPRQHAEAAVGGAGLAEAVDGAG